MGARHFCSSDSISALPYQFWLSVVTVVWSC
nr:MAG TPA: hypothetical protein [Caudoviricetes sp.]